MGEGWGVGGWRWVEGGGGASGGGSGSLSGKI